MKRALGIVSLWLLVSASALSAAGPAFMVTDLETGLTPYDDSGSVHPFIYGYAAAGGRVVFFARLPEAAIFGDRPQCGLWSTDGTEAGTVRLADLCGRLDDHLPNFWFRMVASNGAVAFFADPLDRMWRTDGTAAGTFPLGDLRIVEYTGVEPVFGPGGLLFFVGCAPEAGCGLWRSDGALDGTRLLRDVGPAGFIADGGRVLFTAAGGLWSSDGTPAGTMLLAKVAPVTAVIGPPLLRGDKVYFMTFPSLAAADVWAYDLTARRAVWLRSFSLEGESWAALEQAAGRVLIRRYDDKLGRAILWETDGTPAGTRRAGRPFQFAGVGPIHEAGGRAVFPASRTPGGPSSRMSLWSLERGSWSPAPLTGCPGGCPAVDYDLKPSLDLGGRLYFVGWDAGHGRELWSTDGTGPGTRRVKDLCPGECDGSPYQMAAVSGRLLLVDRQGGFWTSDGSPEGTVRLGSTRVGVLGWPLDLAPLGGGVVFSGFDEAAGFQPWRTDLTPAGTRRIAAVGGLLAASSWPSALAALGGKVLFQACDNLTGGLWASDGTAAGTFLLPGSDVPCDGRYGNLFYPVGNLAFYAWKGRLWRTDGTPGGTVELVDLPTKVSIGGAAGPKLVFALDPPVFLPYPPEGWWWTFWTSDGTPGGTRPAFPYRFGGSPGYFTESGGLVYFYAQASESPDPTQIFRTDGTEAGTFPLLPGSGFSAFALPLVRLHGRTWFLGGHESVKGELWSTDGTVEGTAPVPVAAGRHPRQTSRPLVTFQDALYFFAHASDDKNVWGLWRSDGTEPGTRLVKQLPLPRGYPVPGNVPSTELTAAGSFLFFRLDDNVHGPELWRSDGTAEGTVMVKDIYPGPATSRPSLLTAAGGRLYFGATDGEHGGELWESDGTEAGTRMVQDINPGPAPSTPDQLTVVDGRLYFTADDGEHGRELWALPLPR